MPKLGFGLMRLPKKDGAIDMEAVQKMVDAYIGNGFNYFDTMPVYTFLDSHRFDGKKVIPFATSVSSGLGDSGRQLQQMAGTGNWLEGKRFPPNVLESTVQQWVQSLNL